MEGERMRNQPVPNNSTWRSAMPREMFVYPMSNPSSIHYPFNCNKMTSSHNIHGGVMFNLPWNSCVNECVGGWLGIRRNEITNDSATVRLTRHIRSQHNHRVSLKCAFYSWIEQPDIYLELGSGREVIDLLNPEQTSSDRLVYLQYCSQLISSAFNFGSIR